MRTKHILTALALPALFAACTADDFVNEDFGKVGERAKVGANFTLATGGEANTRYSVTGETKLSFDFEEGDQIGAAIIDNYTPGQDVESWPIIPSLAGNNPFTNDGTGVWTSNAELGIGHYLFVYPYNKKDNNRAAVSYSLPTVQKLYGENGKLNLNAAIEEGDVAVYSSVLKEGETQLDVKLQALFTYPKFVINFDNGLPITSVSQVVLEDAARGGNGFEVKGGFNHEQVAGAFAEALEAEDEKEYWAKKTTADFIINDNETVNSLNATEYTTRENSKYLIAKFPANTPVKVNPITNNKEIEVRFMMPSIALDYAENLKLHVYTNDGVYTIANVENSIQWKETTSDAAKAKAFLRGHSNTMTLKKDAPVKGAELDIVTNVEDWNNLVSKYGATTKKTIAIVGEEFFFDANVEMPSKAVFTIKTPVKVKGNVEMKNVDVEETVTVEKGATLTTGAGFSAATVENKGNVVFAKIEEKGKVVEFNGVETLVNEGAATVAEGAVATFILNNEKGATVENNGTMNISGSNEGIITNNKVMNTTADFTNEAREYKNKKVVNEPVINNMKGAKILAKDRDFVNQALIVNEGVMTCKNESGNIKNTTDGTNEAVLDSKAGALTYITENEGKVIVYSADTENLTIANARGIVEYTTTKASENFKGSLVNTVIAAKDFTIADGSLTTLTFNGTAKLTLGKTATLNALTVNKGTTTLASNLTVSTVTVKEGAMIVVPEKISLTINGNEMVNEGTILVGGTFNAGNIAKEDGGLVEDNGNGTINWAKTPAEEKEEAYQTAVAAFVNTWIANSANATAWSNVTVDVMKKTDWAANVEWVTKAVTKFVVAYNAYTGENITATDAAVDTAIAGTSKFFDAAIKAAKSAADAEAKQEIAKQIIDNTWVGETAFVKSSKDQKDATIATADGQTKMFDKFAEAVNALNSEKKAVTLSLKAFAAKDVTIGMIPAFSYINTFAGSTEYEAAKLWKEASAKYENEPWYVAAKNYEFDSTTTKNNTLQKVRNYFNEINKVDTAGDLLLTKELKPLKDMAPTVIEWGYSNQMIEALSIAVK